MKKKLKEKPKDRHLDVPAEANRDKHINFVALENDEQDQADAPSTGALANDDGDDQQDGKTYRIRKNDTK